MSELKTRSGREEAGSACGLNRPCSGRSKVAAGVFQLRAGTKVETRRANKRQGGFHDRLMAVGSWTSVLTVGVIFCHWQMLSAPKVCNLSCPEENSQAGSSLLVGDGCWPIETWQAKPCRWALAPRCIVRDADRDCGRSKAIEKKRRRQGSLMAVVHRGR